MARFYITTSIMYTNAAPHVGFALELVQADAIARWRRMHADEVRFLTGTDEHGTKIMRSAQAAGIPAQEFVDGISSQVSSLAERLQISHTGFIRTSDQVKHWPAAQKTWQKMVDAGDLYKKAYEGWYCVGHEAFIKPSDLVDGLCPDHKAKPELVKEENWFFRLSKYRDQIRDLIESNQIHILPEFRKKEMLNLLSDAEDVSFSRPAEQLPWGIPVPGDSSQTMYVWADALTNYLSGLGYGTDEADMAFWPADVHLVGKDIVRFHTIIWPAILLSIGLSTPKAVYVHGFITVDGQKMSKTLGNVINPSDLLDQYPADVVRHFMLRELQSTDDSDFSYPNLEKRYESDLANGLGNLVQRVATLIDTKLGGHVSPGADLKATEASLRDVLDDSAYHHAFEQFRLHDAAAAVWAKIAIANVYLNDQAPWKQEGDVQARTLTVAAAMISHIAWLLQPFMPRTASRIAEILGTPLAAELTDGTALTITKSDPLFPRREK